MIYIGIDVAKDKHDCFITNSDSEVLFKAFTIFNNLDGFNDLYQKIESVMDDVTKVKVGLEATGHYSYNLLGYLIDKGLPTGSVVKSLVVACAMFYFPPKKIFCIRISFPSSFTIR